jgi:hypothetical protein
MRLALASLAAFAAVAAAGCSGDDGGAPFPVAPPSDISVATAASTVTGTTLAEMIADTNGCAPEYGLGIRAATQGVTVNVVFPRMPAEGAVYDLSVPGTSDYVVVSATQGRARF